MKAKKYKKQVEKTNNCGPAEIEGYFSPVQVKVYNNIDRAIKSFKQLVQSERIVAKLKEKEGYEKPSEKKRRKHDETMRRLFETEMKNKKILSGEFEKERIKKQEKKDKRAKEMADKAASLAVKE